MNFENIALQNEEGVTVLVVSLGSTLYIGDWKNKSKRSSILTITNEWLAEAAESPTWFFATFLDEWKRIDGQSMGQIEEMMGDDDPIEPWYFTLKGGLNWSDATAFTIEGMGYPAARNKWGYVRYGLDTKRAMSDIPNTIERFERSCRALVPEHGYCGFTVFTSPEPAVSVDAEPLVYAIAQRFPGIDVDIPALHLNYAKQGIKSVNWLTAVGHSFAASHGQRNLLEQTPASCVSLQVPNLTIIRAGTAPMLGDRNRLVTCAEYESVARHLRPLLLQNHRAFHSVSSDHRFDREATEKWLRRFE